MSFSARVYDETEAELPVSRSPTHLSASVGAAAGLPHHVVVHNLSTQGLLIESYHKLEVGSDVSVVVRDLGQHIAHVAWQGGAFYDLIFLQPLPSELIRAKLTDAKVVWGNFADHPSPKSHLSHMFPPATDALPPFQREGLSPRAKLAVIVGGAALCWMVPIWLLMAWLS